MPRRKNDKPTHIYWLIDMRPETLAAGWSNGLPFYCGKTVLEPTHRLYDHKHRAKRGSRALSAVRLRECGDYVRVHVVETVPADSDWADRERTWILIGRKSFREFTNATDGGEGLSGLVFSDKHRQGIAHALRGRKRPPHVIATLIAVNTGRKHSPEARANMCAAQQLRGISAGARAKMTAAIRTPECRAKMSKSQTGRKHSPETRAKIAISNIRRGPRSADTRAKLRIANIGKTIDPVVRKKIGVMSKLSWDAASPDRKAALVARNKARAAARDLPSLELR